jgi:hypothetical protein
MHSRARIVQRASRTESGQLATRIDAGVNQSVNRLLPTLKLSLFVRHVCRRVLFLGTLLQFGLRQVYMSH